MKEGRATTRANARCWRSGPTSASTCDYTWTRTPSPTWSAGWGGLPWPLPGAPDRDRLTGLELEVRGGHPQARGFEDLFQLGRQGGRKAHRLSGERVDEAQPGGVQPGPVQVGPGQLGLGQQAGFGVAVVTHHRVADGAKVDTDLMGAPRLQ